MSCFVLTKKEWDEVLEKLILSHIVFATVSNESGQDYELLKPSEIPYISYYRPKPVTPLKSFFTTVTENLICDNQRNLW